MNSGRRIKHQIFAARRFEKSAQRNSHSPTLKVAAKWSDEGGVRESQCSGADRRDPGLWRKQ